MVLVPEARILDDKTFTYGFHTNPKKYLLIDLPEREGDFEYVNSINIGFFPRVNILLNLTQINNARTSDGIGDRSVQVSFLLLKETEKLPSMVLNLDAPMGINQFLASNNLLVSKEYRLNQLSIVPTLGYGIPYLFARRVSDGSNLLSEFGEARLRRKDSNYLRGLFGGLRFNFQQRLGLNMEFDGKKINSGLHLKALDRIYLSAYTLGFNTLGCGVVIESGIN